MSLDSHSAARALGISGLARVEVGKVAVIRRGGSLSGLARVEVGKVAVIRRGGSLSPDVLENPCRHNGEVSLRVPVISKTTQI
jgi:hypothetical protein